MSKNNSDFVNESRDRAWEIKDARTAAGKPVTLSQAYEIMASTAGFRTWAAMKATMERDAPARIETKTPRPIEATLKDLIRQAQSDFEDMMGENGYNPSSVSSSAAYIITRDLGSGHLRRLLAAHPEIDEADLDDYENQANFGEPRSATEVIRFSVAVTILENIDLTFYAADVEKYGNRPALVRLRNQQAAVREANEGKTGVVIENGSIVIDGVSYGMTSITSKF